MAAISISSWNVNPIIGMTGGGVGRNLKPRKSWHAITGFHFGVVKHGRR